MLKRLALTSFSCFLVATCNFQVAAKVTDEKSTDIKINKQQQLAVTSQVNNGLIGAKLERVLVAHLRSDRTLNKSEQKNSQPQLTAAAKGSYMTLTPTGRVNALGNPLYQLKLYANGQLFRTYTTVSGRAFTQNRNRHRSGTEAPLPDGMYQVAKASIPGTIAEAGDRFLPIQPLFQTGRSALGIHYDPSFEKKNGEDGTSGCIALTNRQELSQVLNYVRTHQPKYLEVHIR